MNKAAGDPSGPEDPSGPKGPDGQSGPGASKAPERPKRPRSVASPERAEQAAGTDRAWRRRRGADRRTGPRRRRDPVERQPGARTQRRAGTQRLRAGRHLGPRRRPATKHSEAARQPVPPEPGQEHHVPAVPRPRTHAALLPPELRPPVGGGAARRLGGAGLADPRPHDRAPAVRPRADLRQHQRRGHKNPRPLPGQPAGRAPGPGHHGRVSPRLPVRVPRGLLRLAGAGKVGLVAVLHDPQVPGRDDRPVPAGGR